MNLRNFADSQQKYPILESILLIIKQKHNSRRLLKKSF
jgi:hypothetical protein